MTALLGYDEDGSPIVAVRSLHTDEALYVVVGAAAPCTERRAAMDVDGWGYVDCRFALEHAGGHQFGPITHDGGAFSRAEGEPT